MRIFRDRISRLHLWGSKKSTLAEGRIIPTGLPWDTRKNKKVNLGRGGRMETPWDP